MNIAIFSPNQNPYSETFIQAHKNHLSGRVFYYYGPANKIKLEAEGIPWIKRSLSARLKGKITPPDTKYLHWRPVIASLQQHSIDVILVEYGNHAHDLLDLFDQIDIPFVVHFHGYDAARYDIVKACDSYTAVFQKASKVIAVSTVMQKELLALGCPSNKLEYNVYGPNDLFLEIQPSYKTKQFVAIGRFTEKKAPHLTILAFARVVQLEPEASLIMIGDGALYHVCVEMVHALGLDKNITLTGALPPEQFKKILSESIALVQHSKRPVSGDMEGTPLAVLESSAAGLPVIATIHAGISDVVVHNKTGFLSEEGDIKTMANHIIALAGDLDRAKAMGENARKRILAHFTMTRHIERLYQILADATQA